MMGRQSRLVLGASTAALVALVVIFALELVDSQSKARRDVEGRFQDRAKASAALTGSLFGSASDSGRADVARRFGGEHISTQALARQVKQSNALYLMVLDSKGRIIAAAPRTPATATRVIEGKPTYVRQLLAGRTFALSNLQRTPGLKSSFGYGQSFGTRFGRRVIISGLDASLISGFLGGSLEDVPNVAGGRAYVLDQHGAIVATPALFAKPGSIVHEPGLLAAAAARRHGSFGHDNYFAADKVKGTPWRVVLAAPKAKLFASVNGTRKWVPWILLVGFALAAMLALMLLVRVLRSAAKLTETNARLGVANEALERRAGELSRSNEQLERFASIASHDLQEPLRKVQTFAERLEAQEGERVSASGRDYLDRMTGAARRMQALIDDLLAFSRITTQGRRIEDVDLADVASEVVADLDAVISETGATVEVGELPALSADPLRMRQLFQNLVSNGIKFRRDGVPPVVRIDGHVNSQDAEIRVSDNGIGFDQRYAGRIFRVFERLHGRETYPGNGIGLALCRRIAERHGGAITAEGRLGEGSTFTVTLPLQPVDYESVPEGPTDKEERPLAPA